MMKRLMLALLVMCAVMLAACQEAPAPAETTDLGVPTTNPEPDVLIPSDRVETPESGLVWQREGGIAGFCDYLVIYADGDIAAYSCDSGATALAAQGSLTQAQYETFSDWLEGYDSFTYAMTDPAVADAMTTSLVFNGNGENAITPEIEESIAIFAQDVFNTLMLEETE